MANIDLPPGLMPSLKDRLFDPDSMGTKAHPGYTLQQIMESVRIDLEDLLNTRRSLKVNEKQYPQLAKSIVPYGLPDLSSFGATTPGKQEEIGRVIEQTIALHEPRLRNIRAKVIQTRIGNLRLRFHIDAELRLDPSPAMTFETEVELTTGQISIREGTG